MILRFLAFDQQAPIKSAEAARGQQGQDCRARCRCISGGGVLLSQGGTQRSWLPSRSGVLTQGVGRDLQLLYANWPIGCRARDRRCPSPDYVGILIPGGARSPALLADDPCVTKFVQDVNAQGGVIACICRGSMLAARSKIVMGRRMTGFNDSV